MASFSLDHANSARSSALVVRVLAILYAIAGAITGIFLAAHQTDTDVCSVDEFGDNTCSTTTDHPYVAAGIGLAFGAFFLAAFVVMIAQYIRFRTTAALEDADIL